MKTDKKLIYNSNHHTTEFTSTAIRDKQNCEQNFIFFAQKLSTLYNQSNHYRPDSVAC